MDKTATFWSVPVAVDDIPETGLHVEIDAPAPVRANLAELAGVRDLSQLAAEFDLTRQGSGAHVSGLIRAQVGQTCVISLEPIMNTVEESIDVAFAPAGTQAVKPGDEPPEPLVGGIVDLGALAIEFLILGIDPYPRKSGAQFAPPKVEADGEHPFAALEILKKRLSGGKA